MAVFDIMQALARTSETSGEEMRRNLKGKPVIDMELADIGLAMKAATALKQEADKAVRLLEEEQARRCNEFQGLSRSKLRLMEAEHAWYVAHPQPNPTAKQMEVLDLFAAFIDGDDTDLVRRAHALVVEMNAHITTWRTIHGESVDVAFARKLREMEG